ncbi:hypothetical protein BH20ACI2_BH20ACI2_01060 [soil metagenome]
MAALDGLIAQIEDKVLRERLSSEVKKLTDEKTFGLVFEDHLPELTPLYSEKVRKGSTVAIRGDDIANVWRVISIVGKAAKCVNRRDGEERHIPVSDLVVVLQFGEPIFPSLVPMDRVKNGPDDAPWHTLIEADNYHALQLLEYLYAGQVDCIYIDPPYNTGDKNWKYNNDYVDSNDAWRHSKWLSLMKKRLRIAKRLLNPENGVLIVTIDEHELHHLRILLQELFPGFYIQMVTTVTNPKGVTQGRFSRVEEYVIYCFAFGAFVADSDDNLLNPPDSLRKPRWKGLLRSGTNARRFDRKNMFYPLLIDEARKSVVGAGDSLPWGMQPDLDATVDGYRTAWPIRTDGSEGNWGVGFLTLRKLIELGYVKCGKYDPKRNTYGVSYISEPNQRLIKSGGIIITGRDPLTNIVSIEYVSDKNRAVKTVWHRTRHDAGAYGSDFLNGILGLSGKFSFPKSIYSVRDSIGAVVRNRPDALVVDFFAGSGTTLNAINLMNAIDSGTRRCILVTNNELSAEEAKSLSDQGCQPGSEEWEREGICRSVTWPRNKYTILGKRDDGTTLDGEYVTGVTSEVETPRTFVQIAFTTVEHLSTLARKKQLVALLGKDKLPQSAVTRESGFVVSENHSASVLFDESFADQWLDALDEQFHITQFFVVTESKSVYDAIKARIVELLGPNRLRDFGELASQAERFTGVEIERIALEYGTDSSNKADGYIVEAASADIDRHFAQAGRTFGNGLHIEYWKSQGDRDADDVKVEALVLANDSVGINEIESFAEGQFEKLYAKFRPAIARSKELRKNAYERLRLAAKEPKDIPWQLPDVIDFKRSVNAPEYEKHLFVEDDGKFRADLGTWEREVIQIELGKSDAVGWLRNEVKKPWSLEIPYEVAGVWKPMFPDLLIVRKVSDGYVFDVLEPHDPTRGDNIAKAIGLAKFAGKHGLEFGRIQLIRKRGNRGDYARLDFTDNSVRTTVIGLTTNDQLDRLFKSAIS